jgi:hypothetical protein
MTHDELIDSLCSHQRMPVGDGSARLLRALVRQGLDPNAILPAAAIVYGLEVLAAVTQQQERA